MTTQTETKNGITTISEANQAASLEQNRIIECQRKISDLTFRRQGATEELERHAKDPWLEARQLVVSIQDSLSIGNGQDAIAECRDAAEKLLMLVEKHCRPERKEQLAETIKTCDVELSESRQALKQAEQNFEYARAKASRFQREQEQRAEEERKQRQAREEERTRQHREALRLRERAAVIRQAARDHERTEADLRKTIETTETRLQERRKEFDSLLSEGGFIPQEQLESQLAGLKEQIAECEAKIEAKSRHDSIDQEMKESITAMEKFSVSLETAERLKEAVQGLREKTMQSLIAPLLERMQAFLDAAAPGKRAYCDLVNDRGRPIFELGWVHDAKKIPLPALSGGESVLFSASLAWAMVDLSDVPLKLLLLEAGDVDAENLERLLTGVDAVKGRLSNVFIATHTKVKTVSESWSLCDLSV